MTTVAAAPVAGLVTSFHCGGMCGPIACGLGTLAKSEGERLTARARFKACKLSAFGGASAMGLLTPFLPCGPFYLVFGAA